MAQLQLDREIHVWAAALEVPAEVLSALRETLLPAEQARAARFRFDQHGNRFTVGRAFLRQVLGSCLRVPPEQLEFVDGPCGKPSLKAPTDSLHFNLAHSEDLALLAVTRIGPVGIDVERVRPLADADELVARFFSPRENAAFQDLPEEQKPAAFYNLWTRKEAWLKATGQGIGHLLNRVEVSFLPGEPARLFSLPEGAGALAEWNLQALAPTPGFAAALAIQAAAAPVRCWQWTAPNFQRV